MTISGAVYREGIAFSPDGAMYVTPAPGGTVASNTFSQTAPNSNVRTIIQQGGIPLIGLSSGSVNSSGAISGISALPLAYPSAYCYFPANILATTIAAGWYYCTFSTTTAGTAFLNTYTSGVPTIPSSPTAVTDGKGAFTGSTGADTAHQITIPALQANSQVLVTFDANNTNNANAKTYTIKLGATTFISLNGPSVGRGGALVAISNTGATNKQISQYHAFSGFAVGIAEVLGTVDTSVSTTLAFTVQRGTATDNTIILPPLVEVAY